MKSFKLSKNVTLYAGFSMCSWDSVYLSILPSLVYSMFRPDEYGVVAHHQFSFQWFNFSADLVYLKTYKVEDEHENGNGFYA
jgi:hypothetical protein